MAKDVKPARQKTNGRVVAHRERHIGKLPKRGYRPNTPTPPQPNTGSKIGEAKGS